MKNLDNSTHYLIRKENKVCIIELLEKIKPLKRGRGNPAGNKRKYLDSITAFDIETSVIKECEEAFCYLWQLSIDNKIVIIGRTIQSFYDNMKIASTYLNEQGLTWVIYVHNLAYEIQFLMGVYDFEPEDLFIIKSRKVVKAIMFGCIEFRCSLALSNMSLDNYLKARNVKHLKQTGKIDYDKFRTPSTFLTISELRYAIYDVVGLVEAIKNELSIERDNLYTIPITVTGYLRREIKRELKVSGRKEVISSIPPLEVFKIAREAFAGGNTHANRYYAGKKLEKELAIKSADESSAYPYIICTGLFPKGDWCKVDSPTFKDFIHKKEMGKAILARVVFKNIRIKEPTPNAAISVSKCLKIAKNDNFLEDNGRILKSDMIVISITDIDFEVIADCYIWDDIVVLELFFSAYGKQPQSIINVILRLFKQKTTLKGLSGFDFLLYNKSKEKINSAYGLEAQNPMKDEIKFINGDYEIVPVPDEEYEKRANKGLPYTWGVWVTAQSRKALHEGLKKAGDKAVYWDTDSIKYWGEVDFTEINEERKNKSMQTGLYAKDRKGVTHYGGVFEEENNGKPYKEFKTLGAKKYVYRDDVGLNVTISGVVKSKGGLELEKHGGIDSFEEGFTFTEAGGTDIIYNDIPSITEYNYNGESIKITRNAVINPSTYTVGITQEYKDLLNKIMIKEINLNELF